MAVLHVALVGDDARAGANALQQVKSGVMGGGGQVFQQAGLGQHQRPRAYRNQPLDARGLVFYPGDQRRVFDQPPRAKAARHHQNIGLGQRFQGVVGHNAHAAARHHRLRGEAHSIGKEGRKGAKGDDLAGNVEHLKRPGKIQHLHVVKDQNRHIACVYCVH